MSDNEIRQILIQRRKRALQTQRRRDYMAIAGSMFCWLGIAITVFMLTAIGG